MNITNNYNTTQKIRILGEAGKWDTCASSASPRKVSVNNNNRIGNTAISGICHSFTENGRCISLFKTLMTNSCIYDCKYCQNSTKCNNRKTMYEPQELAKVFMNLYTRNYVEGLFLSSGVLKNADFTTEKMLEAVRLIRNKYLFKGYIHLKILPGTSKELIKQATEIADRVSVNIEAPNTSRLSMLSDIKNYKTDILRRQAWIKRTNTPAGQTTQLVVGGSNETDLEILKMANWEYENLDLKRIYYSAFNPVEKTPLEKKEKTPLQREHRLYNVDFMMRKYDIKLKEFKNIMEDGNLPKEDPKVALARNYFDKSIEINEAKEEDLIRIPGIGQISLNRIIHLRKQGIKIKKREELHSIGVVLKRADPFIKIGGNYQCKLNSY